MQIEIGKTYEVRNAVKKSFVETTSYFLNDEVQIDKEICWRGGGYQITVLDEWEQKTLQNALDTGCGITCTWFEESELLDCWDGCSEDYYLQDGDFDLENAEEEWDAICEDSDYWDFGAYLEEHYGFKEEEYIAQFVAEIEVELVPDK